MMKSQAQPQVQGSLKAPSLTLSLTVHSVSSASEFAHIHVHDGGVEEIPASLQAILPPGYDYYVQSFETQGTSGFVTSLLLSAQTVESAKKWLSDFQDFSQTTWRVMKTCPTAMKYVLSKTVHRCHHGQWRKHKEGSSRHSKDTGCLAKLTITVRRIKTTSGRKSRRSDPRACTHPTVIKLEWVHNHGINIPAALKFKDVSAETSSKLEELFRNGHSPSSALNVLEMELQVEDPDGYLTKSADRSVCPDLAFCYRLYKKLFEKAYGSADGEDMLAAVEGKIISEFNSSVGMVCAKMSRTTTNELLIAICTPLMQRVHTMMPQSSELVFIDSTGNVDRHGSRIFLLLTHSSSGGLPLGVIITSNEQEHTITEGLHLLKTLLPPNAFGGNGGEGPAVFITDDCSAERKALHSVYPKATLLLCTFHVLQSVWRWLWDNKHGIRKEHRQCLFGHIKGIMYAQDVNAIEEAFQQARNDSFVTRYPSYSKYLHSLYERRQVWAQAFRLQLMIRGNNTNNYAEAAMRVLKDSILQRTKAFNVPQLVDFILCRLEGFYQRRLIAVVNQRPLKWRVQPRKSEISKDDISKTANNTYQVTSQTNRDIQYSVDMGVGVCTCQKGMTGGACKHQEAIVAHFRVSSFNFLPTSPSERNLLLKVATGRDDNVPSGWMDPLQCPDDASETTEMETPDPSETTATTSATNQRILDPQLARLDSLHAQRDLHNAFDRRLHGSISQNRHLRGIA